MRIGKLRKIVDIQQPTRAADGTGEMMPTWSTFVAGLYAEIEPLSGAEKIQAQAINASTNMMVRVRYIAGITPQMRVSYGTRTFQIVNVQNVKERGRELELLCIEQE